MRSLTRAEAAERAELVAVESYHIDLDLTGGGETFRSTVTIGFRASTGGDTFVELKPARLRAATLNGQPVDPTSLAGNRLPLAGLRATNELVVDAEMAYSHTGEGLHRFVDPSDGETYLYAMSFLDEAQRIFACFDQPDLKAPVRLSVTAPPDWLVVGNGEPAEPPSGGRWRFAVTAPLATYFVSLIAGPYHAVRREHDGIPLAFYCRRSLAEHLDKDADELFTITGQCLDRIHQLFGVRYPFGKYDQAWVPEFNAGAMENPGLVTLRDDYLFRSAVTDSARQERAITMAHEMAHMWFGDLVTMRWWDDLWLNESFAEYLGVRVTSEATRFDGAWTAFGLRRKAWGYAADQRPSTHPVAPAEVRDTAMALLNFDGISYAKGASVLRQLVSWLGDDAFRAGLRAHFDAHRFGNATLDDLLGALSTAGGRDLSAWARVWLRQPQVNTLRPEVRLDAAGNYASVTVHQSAPAAYPTLRPHRLGIGLYDGGPAGVRLRQRIEVDLDPGHHDGRTAVPALSGVPAADLLLLNDGDLTYAKVRLDDASAAAVPALLPAVADPLTRAVIWGATVDAVRDGERPVAELLALVVAGLPAEPKVIVVEDVLRWARDLVDRYLAGGARPAALALLAHSCDRLLAVAPSGGSGQLAAARGLVATTVDTGRLIGWRGGVGVPSGLEVDTEFRWQILHRLAVLGAVTPADVEVEAGGDRSAAGEQWAARCRASLPDPVAKQAAWHAVTADLSLSNRLVEANAEGFWQPEQAELTQPYVERYFSDMPQVAAQRTAWLSERVAALAYPRFAVASRTRKLAAELLTREDLTAGLRRAVVDADDDLGRALAARQAAGSMT